MSAKWSELVVENNVLDTDLFCFARPPDNFTVTILDIMFSGLGSRNVGAGPVGTFYDGPTATVTSTIGPGGWKVRDPLSGTNFIDVQPGTLMAISAEANKPFVVGGNGGTIVFSASGGMLMNPALGQVITINWSPTIAGNWAGVPLTMNAAIERLGQAVAGLLGGPIP